MKIVFYLAFIVFLEISFLFFQNTDAKLQNAGKGEQYTSVETRSAGRVTVADLHRKVKALNAIITRQDAALKKLAAKMGHMIANGIDVPWLRGRDGIPGKSGKDGRDGTPGKPGRDGRDGKPGVNDLRGPKGDPGPKGTPGPQGPQGPKGAVGVQYVRWGRTSCPSWATLIYHGRVGGEGYGHRGGASQYVCLPMHPQFRAPIPGHQHSGYMYGAEYEVSDRSPFTNRKALHNHEIPCAVCYVTTRAVEIMVPARYECPTGWSREYHGYLMTAHYNAPHSSQFICVDQDAEGVPGTHQNQDGATLYPVEGICGSLPCNPYVSGYELTCTVCTK